MQDFVALSHKVGVATRKAKMALFVRFLTLARDFVALSH
jgi:hypothetical protein